MSNVDTCITGGLPVFEHCMDIAPHSFFFASTSLPSSSRRNWYFTPAALTPPAWNGVKSLLFITLAMLAASCGSILKAYNNKICGCMLLIYSIPQKRHMGMNLVKGVLKNDHVIMFATVHGWSLWRETRPWALIQKGWWAPSQKPTLKEKS